MHLVHSGMPWGINMTERIFYSATTNGFYPYSLFDVYISAGTWPEDAVEITERWYSYLLDGQSAGKVIIANEYGSPELSAPPLPTEKELIAQAETNKSFLMSRANEVLAPLQDAVDLGLATDDESELLLAWKTYRVLLNRVDTAAAPEIEWPEVPGNVA